MLTELKIRNTVWEGKNRKLWDGRGLYLLVTRAGKYWRFDYRYAGKRKTISFGVYPEVGLKEARERLDEARRLLRDGIDPSEHRKAKKREALLFKDIAERWFKLNEQKWSDGHRRTIFYRLQRYILPCLGGLPVNSITREAVLDFLKKIEATGQLETARRVHMIVNSIFQYANELSITDKNPATRIVKYLASPEKRHYPTLLGPSEIGSLLTKIKTSDRLTFVVKSALLVLAYTFVRPGELRHARWEEFNLEEGIWDIPPERTKTKVAHRVYLSRQVVEILKKLKELFPTSAFVFPGRNGGVLSENTLNKALKILGYDTKRDITAHGFRAMSRTLLHEKLGYQAEIIEHQLGHRVPDVLGQAYNRTRFYEQRKEMMQAWADYLDSLSANGYRLP